MAFFTFVAMPFGVKQSIDFNRVFREYFAPGLFLASLNFLCPA